MRRSVAVVIRPSTTSSALIANGAFTARAATGIRRRQEPSFMSDNTNTETPATADDVLPEAAADDVVASAEGAPEGEGASADGAESGSQPQRQGRPRRERGGRGGGDRGGDRGERGGRGRDEPRRDHRGRSLDLSPPRFNVDELAAVAGMPLWQSVHDAAIVEVTPAAVVVEVKPLGHEPLKALVKPEELADLTVGNVLKVRLLDPPKEGAGLALASAKQARDLARFDEMQSSVELDAVPGAVVREVKGGYSVALFTNEMFGVGDGAIRAFLPASQATLSRFGPQRGDRIVGAVGDVKVGEVDLERGNIVVSRKAVLFAERDRETKERLSTLKEGDVVTGVVRSIMPYGAFLDVDGLDGLLHRDDISWDHRGRIDQHLRVGQKLEVKVIAVKERKLKLGLRQLRADPWGEVRSAFAQGAVVKGVVTGLADFGVFVKLPLPENPNESIEGLIHVSEISYQKVRHPSAKFQIGEEIEVKVIGLDADNRRMSLSTRALEPNPFQAIAEKFPAGTVVKAKVKTLADFGAFIALSESVDGMVHIGEISWTEHPQHPSELLTIGQEVEAVVMSVDTAKQRVSCSIKRTQENPFDVWEKKYRPGTRHTMKVIRADDKGATLAVEAGLSCYCSWRDLLDKDGNAVERATDAVKQGMNVEVEVRTFDRRFKKVSVSMRAVVEGETKKAYDDYKKKEHTTGGLNSLADKLKGVKLGGGN
jgi:small subunit ribosomal protein S1